MGIIRDITERKHAEEQVERLNKNLIGKNKELEQVLYVTSHDLRSPLVNVEGFNRELEISIKELMTVFESWEVPPDILEKINPIIEKDIPESLKYIHSSTDKMDALLAGLLKISRIGRLELHKTQLDMNLLMGEIVEIFEFRLKEAGVKLKISELPSCIGDEHQLNQVFSNLIDNAIKYLDPNQPGIINISGYNEGERSVYCVEDNGIGIASDHQEKIFGLFYQLEPGEEKGEGLGLTAIRKILDMHDGKIWVESEYGKGSKFFVSLPA
jgi:signal transduction histidine kinase